MDHGEHQRVICKARRGSARCALWFLTARHSAVPQRIAVGIRGDAGGLTHRAFPVACAISAPTPLARRAPSPYDTPHGQVAEWSKAHAWKVCRRGTVSRVRIPLCPPSQVTKSDRATQRALFFFLFPKGLRKRPTCRNYGMRKIRSLKRQCLFPTDLRVAIVARKCLKLFSMLSFSLHRSFAYADGQAKRLQLGGRQLISGP